MSGLSWGEQDLISIRQPAQVLAKLLSKPGFDNEEEVLIGVFVDSFVGSCAA